jgi:hypothetical protein
MQVTTTPGRGTVNARITGLVEGTVELTPKEHVYAQGSPERPSLQEEIAGEFANHICEVEDGCEPAVLLSHEARILPEPKNRLSTEGCFVCLLDAITQPHEREEEAVDFGEQFFVLCWTVVAFGDDSDFAYLFRGDELEVV